MNNIKVGDWVVCTNPTCLLELGKNYKVEKVDKKYKLIYVMNDIAVSSYGYYGGDDSDDRFRPVPVPVLSINSLILSLIEANMDNDMGDVEHYCLAILETLQKPIKTVMDVVVEDTYYEVKSIQKMNDNTYVYIDSRSKWGIVWYVLNEDNFSL